MLEIIIFILIYLITVAIIAFIEYRESYYKPRTLGELLDNLPSAFFLPGINTIFLIIGGILLLFYGILKITGIVWLWNKLMNIKL